MGAEEYRDLVLTRSSGRGRTSGVEVQNEGASLLRVRGGKITSIVSYWDRGLAFADLGLSPEGDAADPRG